jgi:hypothetical protein
MGHGSVGRLCTSKRQEGRKQRLKKGEKEKRRGVVILRVSLLFLSFVLKFNLFG